MTETTITSDGIVWYRNPFPEDIKNKWLDMGMIINMLRFGWSINYFPEDTQQAIED